MAAAAVAAGAVGGERGGSEHEVAGIRIEITGLTGGDGRVVRSGDRGIAFLRHPTRLERQRGGGAGGEREAERGEEPAVVAPEPR
jgi:hypothetical protein